MKARLWLVSGVVAVAMLDVIDRLLTRLALPPPGVGMPVWPTFPKNVIVLCLIAGGYRAVRGRTWLLAATGVFLIAWSGAIVQQLDRHPELDRARWFLSLAVGVLVLVTAVLLGRLRRPAET